MRKWLSIGLVIVMALSLVIGILGPTVASAKEKGATDTVKAFIKALPNLKKTNTTAGYWVVDGQDNVKAKLDAMPKDTKISLKLSGKLATKGQDTGPATVIGKYKLEVKYQKVKSSGQQTITFTLDKKGNPKKYPWLISNCDLDLGSLKVVSKFSEYGGYSLPIYDEYVRSSQYVKMRDGTKLAVDIFRPAVDGKAVSKPWPVIWILGSSRSCSSWISPTISSSISSMVTRPAMPPYSSTTRAMCTLRRCSSCNSSLTFLDSGTK